MRVRVEGPWCSPKADEVDCDLTGERSTEVRTPVSHRVIGILQSKTVFHPGLLEDLVSKGDLLYVVLWEQSDAIQHASQGSKGDGLEFPSSGEG